MHPTEYQTDTKESGHVIYTTEQWFRLLQASKMDCETVAKPMSFSSEKNLIGDDFLKHG